MATTEKKNNEMERRAPRRPVLRVSKKTDPKNLSKTIVGCVKDFQSCELLCVMGGSLWQASKAIILASSELKRFDIDLNATFGFIEPRPIINGEAKTGIRLTLHPTVPLSLDSEDDYSSED